MNPAPALPNSPTAALRQRIHQHWRCDEDDLLDSLVDARVRELDGYARRIDHGGGEVPATGCFFAPRAYEIDALSRLSGELDAVCAAIAATGYGLTLGIHSRIDATVRAIIERLAVGNIYVNRNQIGAVVGVQPFGGHGLSGTGPKAGGPHTLYRFAAERSVSVDTTAAGGNASLLADGE